MFRRIFYKINFFYNYYNNYKNNFCLDIKKNGFDLRVFSMHPPEKKLITPN